MRTMVVEAPLLLAKSSKLLHKILKMNMDKYGMADSNPFYNHKEIK